MTYRGYGEDEHPAVSSAMGHVMATVETWHRG